MNKYRVFSKLWFLALLLVAFVAGCAENGAEVGPVVGSKSLVSIAVTPALATIAIGGVKQYVVTATWSDQTTSPVTTSASWSKVDAPTGTVVATLSPAGTTGGLATGVAAGTSTITATYTFDGITKTASAGLVVSPAAALTIVPGAVCSASSGDPTIPTVTSSNPTSGNQIVTTSTTGVPNSGKLIIATFSLAMDPTTVVAPNTFTLKESVSGANVPGAVTMDDTNKVATFTTSAALTPNMDYTASITTAAMSSGTTPTAIACPYEWDFKTIIPVQTGLGPINLGSAGSFGIMATSAITSTGFSVINGDVSLNPGTSMTGFPAGIVNGTIHINDTESAQARADLLTAYNSAKALPIGTTISAGADLGALYPLGIPPGTYTSGSTMLVSTTLTLDAGGDADATWVFQVGSSLTTQANIVLTGGAQAKNVFWVPTEDATIGVGTVFYGTILSGRDVTAVTGSTINGRILAGAINAGTIALQTATVNVPAP
ncbi:MAG: ice-binding family protein [Desulfuromonadaceae bacterium]